MNWWCRHTHHHSRLCCDVYGYYRRCLDCGKRVPIIAGLADAIIAANRHARSIAAKREMDRFEEWAKREIG